jgi:hypothetical protein
VYLYHRAEESFGNLFDPFTKNSSDIVALSHKEDCKEILLAARFQFVC